MSITIQDVKNRVGPAEMEVFCRNWLPDGRRQGAWWVARCPWREDRNPSFGVSLTSQRWRDFSGAESGDIIDLTVRLHGGTVRQAVEMLADILGMR